MNLLFVSLSPEIDPEVYKTAVVIFIIILVMFFILSLLNKMLKYKLKNKIMNNNISSDLASIILESNSDNEGHNGVKWFLVLSGFGTGLFIVNQSLPLGIHSIGILAISVAVSFLVYSIYTKYSQN